MRVISWSVVFCYLHGFPTSDFLKTRPMLFMRVSGTCFLIGRISGVGSHAN
jgi:hypothetical protein